MMKRMYTQIEREMFHVHTYRCGHAKNVPDEAICKKAIELGASRHDILGGILETEDPDFETKKRKLHKVWEPYRINHLSWWAEELASEE